MPRSDTPRVPTYRTSRFTFWVRSRFTDNVKFWMYGVLESCAKALILVLVFNRGVGCIGATVGGIGTSDGRFAVSKYAPFSGPLLDGVLRNPGFENRLLL